MSTTATTTTIDNDVATIKVVIPDSTGHTELVLSIKEAAKTALAKVKEEARWIFRTKKNDTTGAGDEAIFIDGKSDSEAFDYLVGIFGDSDAVLLTTNLVGGWNEQAIDDDADEEEQGETIIGQVKVVYAEDEDGASSIPNLLTSVPQLVVQIDSEGNTTVFVRKTNKALDKVVANAPLIYGALSKIAADEIRS